LLPNRVYEGGCFGVPAIAGKATETGRWIERLGLGWTFEESLDENLAAFFKTLNPEDWGSVRKGCAARPRDQFTGERDYQRLSERLVKLAGQLPPAPQDRLKP
jgi:succinoglycan biosynthesis protein ExoL